MSLFHPPGRKRDGGLCEGSGNFVQCSAFPVQTDGKILGPVPTGPGAAHCALML